MSRRVSTMSSVFHLATYQHPLLSISVSDLPASLPRVTCEVAELNTVDKDHYRFEEDEGQM
jgi:hypothetical protein